MIAIIKNIKVPTNTHDDLIEQLNKIINSLNYLQSLEIKTDPSPGFKTIRVNASNKVKKLIEEKQKIDEILTILGGY